MTMKLALDKGIARLESFPSRRSAAANESTSWDDVARLLMTAAGGRRVASRDVIAIEASAGNVDADLAQLADQLEHELLTLS